MSKARTAGQALRARLDADLTARGSGWEWTAFDLEVVESAVHHADRAAQLQRAYDRELAGESPSVSASARLTAEICHQERRVMKLVAQLTAPDEASKVRQQQAAANAQEPEASARGGAGGSASGAGGGVVPRLNPALAAAQRDGTGNGPVYRHLLDRLRDVREHARAANRKCSVASA